MAEKRNPLGPTGQTVRNNVRRLREGQNLGYAELSRRLKATGRSIPELGLRRIEEGGRRVDTDDLMALAVALDVTPATLLMPEVVSVPGVSRLAYRPEWDTPVHVTGLPSDVNANIVWMWVTGQSPPRPAYDDADFASWAARSIPGPWLTLRISGMDD